MSAFFVFLIAFVVSLIPIIVWLWFIEHEDKHPEPVKITIATFIAGMIAVIVVIPFEKIALDYLGGVTVFTIIIWAAIEELAKLGAAAFIALRRIENDEPIDSMMYLIATALGFSALENTLFVIHPLLTGDIAAALTTGNLRFLGATMLHLIASSTIGAFLALSFYKSQATKGLYLFFGIILAITLHASFNLSIIYLNDSTPAVPFYAVWIVFIGILLAFEKVKHINNTSSNNS